ncbi:polysaccharide lyase 6 family protein [Pedobacter insulae]|uniref:Poly(Beta-D-mannuronate) lyase n=1 Tax=Pedobacter insulae TaxID=414048 RepID=A0A1I2UZV2_9SPHI|nr:polysaccharide lyase 6 family protein [Pedobacter insulae]SFG81699.1 poly(beta-D-mannuronate) lyase [Pedobacter insulae]
MNLKIYFTSLLLACTLSGFTKEYKIGSASELIALKLLPGDQVILRNGDWEDQNLLFKGNGTSQKPIILKAENALLVNFKGNSSLKIAGTWLVVDGLNFKEGATSGEDVILFAENSSNCRLTNSSVVNFNPNDKAKEYTYVSLYGNRHRVDHCYFEGKTNIGPTLVVWLSAIANYHQIDHNYFGPRPDINGNGGESIRIGTSTWSMYDSFTTVNANIFAQCNGETEIISVKSCRNTVSNNLFYESVGTLTLRHGNYNAVFGNIFIGNGIKDTGGIRIIGEHHNVYNNYLQGLAGTGLRAAVSVMDGLPNPILVSHWQVKNATVVANTIVDCKEAFSVGAGKNTERILPPQRVLIANNLIGNTSTAVTMVDQAADVTFNGNMVDDKGTITTLPAGFKLVDAKLKKHEGIWQPEPTSVVKGAFTGNFDFIHQKDVGASLSEGQLSILQSKNVGPNWMNTNKITISNK